MSNGTPSQGDLFAELDDAALAVLTPDEIYDRADAELLQRLHEDSRIERKSAGITPDLLSEYLSMWANTSPHGGLIVVGQHDVKRGGGFEGLSAKGERINKLEKAPRRFCADAVVCQKRISVTNDAGRADYVILLRVPYNRTVVVRNHKGKAFQRWGDEKHELTEAEIRQLEADKGSRHPEREPCVLAYPDAFNRKAIATFAARIKQARDWEPSHTDEEILELMRLGNCQAGDAFVPNVACALLFAKDPLQVIPGSRILFERFDGVERHTGAEYNVVKERMLEGPVPTLIADAAAMVDSQVREFSHLDERGRFTPIPEYPRDAWYEAIVNACAHRAYGSGLKNSNIFVRMFDDRLEIESPGPFPPFVTPENLFHNPRNPQLMHAMRHLEYVKCAAEGTRRMKRLMAEMELPEPEFVQSDEGGATVLVTLRNNLKARRPWVDQDIEKLVGSAVADSLTDDERKCLNFIAQNGEMSVMDGTRIAGRSWETMKKLLVGLEKRGILWRDARDDIRGDPKGRYKLKVPEAS